MHEAVVIRPVGGPDARVEHGDSVDVAKGSEDLAHLGLGRVAAQARYVDVVRLHGGNGQG